MVAKAGSLSLAVFIMRPQAEYQIGAQLKITIIQSFAHVKQYQVIYILGCFNCSNYCEFMHIGTICLTGVHYNGMFSNNEHYLLVNNMIDDVYGKGSYREADILLATLDVFRNTTGLQMVIESGEVGITTDTIRREADAYVRLDAPGISRQFVVEVKYRLTEASLGMAVQQLQFFFPRKGLIVTNYVNPKMAERLKSMNMSFLDLAGNAYLNEPPVYIYIKGNRPVENPYRKPAARVFQPSGLKVLFALLCEPKLVFQPYRDIARAAGVALGTVARVITDLRKLGYLLDMYKNSPGLVNKEKLVERWVTTYPELLRPKLVLGCYSAVDSKWWAKATVADSQACWGGEVAAAKLTGYLRPERVTVYIWDKPGKLLLANKLKKNPDGDVEILEAFWQDKPDWPHHELAPPLLIYADLMATGDARNLETAKMIYERELAGLIREN